MSTPPEPPAPEAGPFSSREGVKASSDEAEIRDAIEHPDFVYNLPAVKESALAALDRLVAEREDWRNFHAAEVESHKATHARVVVAERERDEALAALGTAEYALMTGADDDIAEALSVISAIRDRDVRPAREEPLTMEGLRGLVTGSAMRHADPGEGEMSPEEIERAMEIGPPDFLLDPAARPGGPSDILSSP